MFQRPSKTPYFVYKIQTSLPFLYRIKQPLKIFWPFWPISLTLILLLLRTSRFSSEKSSFRRCRVKALFPLSTQGVGCDKITWQFGRVFVMTLLSCNRSSRISHNILETESFVPTCKIITSGFFFNIGITWWLISA